MQSSSDRASAARSSRSRGPGALSATVSYTLSSSASMPPARVAVDWVGGCVRMRRRLSMARFLAIRVSQVSGWLCAASKLPAARQTLTKTSWRMSSACPLSRLIRRITANRCGLLRA